MHSIHPRSLTSGTLHSHWIDVLDIDWPWKNFTPAELACRKTGEHYHHTDSFDALQQVRSEVGRPVYINSGHRSWLHNIAVGGAPLSCHRFFAADISLSGFMDMLATLYQALKRAGFKGFGFYQSFIHVDMGRGRFWFGSDDAKAMWMPILRTPPVNIAL